MKQTNCMNCKLRAKYESNPGSLLGRLWRWHAGWCPGWKAFMKSLPDEQRKDLAGRYHMKKYIQ